MRVAPVIGVLRVSEPEVGHAHTAGEPDFPVDDENLPMRPVVQLLEGVPMRRVEVDDVAASLTEALDVILVHLARADGVDDDPDVDAARRGALERVGEPVGDLAFLVDVGLEAHAMARAVDGLEHRREHLIAVDEHVVLVADDEIRGNEGGQIIGGAGIFSGHVAPQLEGLLVLRDRQTRGDDDRCDDQHANADSEHT